MEKRPTQGGAFPSIFPIGIPRGGVKVIIAQVINTREYADMGG
jgi:hypothetical protein